MNFLKSKISEIFFETLPTVMEMYYGVFHFDYMSVAFGLLKPEQNYGGMIRGNMQPQVFVMFPFFFKDWVKIHG